jgi:hypothetical protein
MRIVYWVCVLGVGGLGIVSVTAAQEADKVTCPPGYVSKGGGCVRRQNINEQAVEEPRPPSHHSDHPRIPVCKVDEVLKDDKCVPAPR